MRQGAWVIFIGIACVALLFAGMAGPVAGDAEGTSGTEATLIGQDGPVDPDHTPSHPMLNEIPSDGEVAVLTTITHGPADAIVLLAAYSKYNDVSPLAHPLRSDIMGVVAATPGLYFTQLVARTNRPSSTVKYHMRILEREGELTTATIFGHLRLFSKSISPEAYAYLAAMRESATARVLEEIERADEPLTTGELAEAIDRSPSTVSYHLSRFEEEGLISRERHGESIQISLTPALTDITIERDARASPPTGG